MRFLTGAVLCLLNIADTGGQPLEAQAPHTKRPIAVTDAIAMTRLADPDAFHGSDARFDVAQFAPDGAHFLVVLRTGDLAANVNRYAMYLFRTADALRPSPPVLAPLLTMSSSSNRDAISNVRWLADNETIAFLGEHPGEVSQVYLFNIRTRATRQLTHHATPVIGYDITPDGRHMIYLAEPPGHGTVDTAAVRRFGVVITTQYATDLLAGDDRVDRYHNELFVQHGATGALRVSVADEIAPNALAIAPDGRYATVAGSIASTDLPAEWAAYLFPPTENDYLHQFFHATRRLGASPFVQYALIDTHTGIASRLWNAPQMGARRVPWAPDSRSFTLDSVFLPLDGSAARRTTRYAVRVEVPSGAFHILTSSPSGASSAQALGAEHRLVVTLGQSLETPPRLEVTDTVTKQHAVLLDLNPRFAALEFGPTKVVEWSVHGVPVLGGLYLPPGYKPGMRYPLVIQTHGFTPDHFSMDGRDEWSSAFAARPLAAQGFVVLQASTFKDPADHDRMLSDTTLGRTPAEAAKHFNALAYEAAIDHLDREGVIDRGQVGISGFSRTVCFVAYMLTHTSHPIKAAALTDGIDCGYFQHIAYDGGPDDDDLNGGQEPFGSGIDTWVRESPSFRLDKVEAPVRLVGIERGAILEHWEWFSGLTMLGKPVDFVDILDGSHLMQKPQDRRVAMEGLVDWFRFWLKGEEDPDPSKASQYARWRTLRRTDERPVQLQ